MNVSLILPAYNNAKYVEIALKAILDQKLDRNSFEILVIDDGSDLDIVENVNDFGLAVRFIRKEHSGRSLTRNRGIQEASGDILVFMDSDMIMSPDFLAFHLKQHLHGTADVILGKVCHIPARHFHAVADLVAKEPSNYDYLMELVEPDQYLKLAGTVFEDEEKKKTIPWVCCLFSNCSVKRDTVLRLGGFDSNFQGWGLEDIEFGYRLYKNGCNFEFYPDIINFHVDHFSDGKKMLADMAHNLKYFQKKYPENAIKHYSSFVAGFLSLDGLYARIAGKQMADDEQNENAVYFKPISYTKDKA